MFKDFLKKSDLLERHTPVMPYTASTPPPLPPSPPIHSPKITNNQDKVFHKYTHIHIK